MQKLLLRKPLCYNWRFLSIIKFLIFILISVSTPEVNTQTLYPPLMSQGLFSPLGLSYKQTIFPYTTYNYMLNPIGSLQTSFVNPSFNPASRYSIPFSQPNLTSYFLQQTQNQSSVTTYSSLSSLPQSLFLSSQNTSGYFSSQPSFRQDWGSLNLNISSVASYTSTFTSPIWYTSILRESSYPYIYYSPVSIYGQKTSVPSVTPPQQNGDEIIGTIGIISDIHYTDGGSTDRRYRYSLSGPRFYSEAGDDLADFVNKMNLMKVDAAIELGDFIDVHSGNSVLEYNTNTHNDGAHGEAILFEAESIYSKLSMPYYHVIGNWDMCDYDFATADEWFKYIVNGRPDTLDSLGGTLYNDATGNPVSRYYSFKFGRVLGIVLDSSGSASLGDDYLMNTTGIYGTGYVPKDQLRWLKDVLEKNQAGENLPVIIFIHPFLYPVFPGNNYYMCRNHSDVRSTLEADENVIAVMSGHHHPGAQGWWGDTNDNPYSNVYNTATGVFGVKYNGIKYFNLRGSIIGWGSDPAKPIEEPSNVYYILRVKKGSTFSVEVETF